MEQNTKDWKSATKEGKTPWKIPVLQRLLTQEKEEYGTIPNRLSEDVIELKILWKEGYSVK